MTQFNVIVDGHLSFQITDQDENAYAVGEKLRSTQQGLREIAGTNSDPLQKYVLVNLGNATMVEVTKAE